MNNLHHHLPWGEAECHFLAEGFGFNPFQEKFNGLHIDIGLEKGEADFLEGILDVFLADFSLTAEVLENLLDLFG